MRMDLDSSFFEFIIHNSSFGKAQMLMDVHETKLANGVRVITSSLPHVESITLGLWVGAGARYESKKMSGISHFIEHLLFKGTKKRSARDISRAIEGHGGHLNGFTNEENTCYYAHVAYDQLLKALDVLSDMYLDPRLDETDIHKECRVIIEEIMMYRDQPQHMVHEMLAKALWKDHSLGRPIIGEPETLGGMTRKHILEYKEHHYIPGNTLFALAGKLDHDSCVEKIERFLGELGGRNLPGFRRVTPTVAQDSVVLQSKKVEQSHLAIGIRLFGRGDKRRYALRILNAILGENMSSRLFQVVREKHGLAYSVHSIFQLFKDSGALIISAGLECKGKAKAMELIVRELVRMKEQAVGAGELKRAKDYAIGTLRLGLESTTHQMMWLGDNIMYYGKFIPPEEVIKKLSDVTAEDVQKLASSVLRSSRVSLAMISPGLSGKDEDRIKSLFKRL